MSDQELLKAALEEARKGLREGGLPIGSVLADGHGRIVARGHNLRVQTGDPTAHAETVCLRNAGRRRDWADLTLVSTLSPCIMCTGTALLPHPSHRCGRKSQLHRRGRLVSQTRNTRSHSRRCRMHPPDERVHRCACRFVERRYWNVMFAATAPDVVQRRRGNQWVAGIWRSGFSNASASLAGRVDFRSHLQIGQRVATE
jgi:hypothetical protein